MDDILRKKIRDVKDSIINYKELEQKTFTELGYLSYKIFDGVCQIDGKELYQLYSNIKRFRREIERNYNLLDKLTSTLEN